MVTEWCGELIDSGHEYMLGLCARFNLPVDDLKAAEPMGSTDTFYFGSEYYTYAEANADFQA
jgi:monoamine oxidase